jgi:hypothetical protein
MLHPFCGFQRDLALIVDPGVAAGRIADAAAGPCVAAPGVALDGPFDCGVLRKRVPGLGKLIADDRAG